MIKLLRPRHTTEDVALRILDHLENEYPALRLQIWREYLISLPNRSRKTICHSIAEGLDMELSYVDEHYKECRERMIWKIYKSR
jgi:hypothetical protein